MVVNVSFFLGRSVRGVGGRNNPVQGVLGSTDRTCRTGGGRWTGPLTPCLPVLWHQSHQVDFDSALSF